MDVWMGTGEWFEGRWSVTVYFISIVSFSCSTPGVAEEVWKINNIQNVLFTV